MFGRLVAFCALTALTLPAFAEDKMPLELKVVLKKDSIAWPYDQKPQDFEASLKEAIKTKGKLPKPPAMDIVLQATNTGKYDLVVYVDGDANVVTLMLKGPGVITTPSGLAFTTDFRFPTAVKLSPGKSHEVPVKSLADGFRGTSRYVYPTAPGEYTLTATYQLSDSDGSKKGPLLKSGEVKFKVEEPK